MWINLCSVSKYNKGILDGELINLPVNNEWLKEKVSLYGDGENNSVAIYDFELPFEIKQHDDVFKINNLCNFINDNQIDHSCLSHMEFDLGESVLEMSKEDIIQYISNINIIKASSKKEFCLEYYKEIGYDLDSIPDEIRNATNWEHVFEQLEIALCITYDKSNATFYYTQAN